ncbi:MAG: hypothetical protein JWQ73_3144 [Variovorax sp.]|jgi:two-component system chemotaxis response regulator CheB|nr:hypothetical protein [Variovorax sp.]
MTSNTTAPSTWATAGSGKEALFGARRDIVVIGAGTGGLSALSKLLSAIPASFDAAILVTLDSGDQPASVVLQILQSYSKLQVSFATESALIRRGQVILTPQGCNMRIEQAGIIALESVAAYAHNGPSANVLFKSAAASYGHRVIGIVLSGATHDGTTGLTAVEAAGGVGIVQSPEEAGDPGMPANAIRADHPNYCSTLDDMALLMVSLSAGETPLQETFVKPR